MCHLSLNMYLYVDSKGCKNQLGVSTSHQRQRRIMMMRKSESKSEVKMEGEIGQKSTLTMTLERVRDFILCKLLLVLLFKFKMTLFA